MNAKIMILLFVIVFTSCFKDKGNYTYGELEEIKIEGIQDEYTVIYMRDHLQISPEVITSDPDADLEYKWSMQNEEGIISNELLLDTFVNWTPDSYRLILGVTNKRTGYTVYETTDVAVNTEFSIGWYVLKDNGETTDIDLYTETEKIPNVIQMVNGSSMQGIGKKFCFYRGHDVFDPESNTYSGKNVLFALTDRDVNGIDAMTAYRWRRFEDLFFEPLEKQAPNVMIAGWLEAYMINDGKIYTLGMSSATNGKFGAVRHVDGDYDKYYLSQYVYCDGLKMNMLVYDTVGCSFYTASDRQDYLSIPTNETGSEMIGQNTNKRLLYMGTKVEYMGTHAYAVMQDKSDPELKMISRIKINGGSTIDGISFSNDTLPENSAAYHAEWYAMSYSEEVMYFVSNGGIYSKTVSGKKGAETLEYTIPGGEQVTFLRSLNVRGGDIRYNYLMLGTEVNGSYKVRCFGKTTAGHLNPVPEVELPRENETSEGRASDVIFIHPSITTYIQAY